MLDRWLIWVATLICFSAVWLVIHFIHVFIDRVLPDSKFKRALLKDRKLQPATVDAQPRHALVVSASPESYIRRSLRLTWNDPSFRRGMSIFMPVIGAGLVAGLTYGLYLLLVWMRVVQ